MVILILNRFKLKLNEKEIKKSSIPFFDIAISNWQKKPAVLDPASVNPNWKTSKSAPPVSVQQAIPAKTPTASTTGTNTSKPVKFFIKSK